MCANVRLPENQQHSNLLKKFSLKAKVDFTRSPTFCGWNLSRYGIVKKPELIAARLAVAKQKGEVNLVIDSYFLEHLYAYDKGDHLFEILSERELEHHYNLTRFFVQNGKLLKGESKRRFLETKEVEGGLFGECIFGNEGIFRDYINRVKNKVEIDSLNSRIFFFRENHGAVSFIYLKNPGAYFNCPAVVFDFNKGLPLTIIKIGKNANAISACNQRLFNREGKKAVFAAQGEVNLSFDA